MKHYSAFLFSLLLGVLYSCNNQKEIEQLDPGRTERFLVEQVMSYWDLHYRFPTSYLQGRDTLAWFFPEYAMIDSILSRHASEIVYTDHDTALLITYRDDTMAFLDLPCSCEYDDLLPYGPRAFNDSDNLILDDKIMVSENGYLEHLTYDLVNNIYPTIEKEMNKTGYVRVDDGEREYPQYLLIEYLPETDSIRLIKACAKYSYLFYEDYAKIIKNVLSEYCKNNHVSRLLTPVEIYKGPEVR